MNLKKIAADHWEWAESVGWHNKTPLEQIALIASEVGEAANECRGDVPTNKLGAELADIILRTIDLAADESIDIEQEVLLKMEICRQRGTRGRKK